ncbi:hypothetical protein N566_24695 [Streptomycetaceae bacterium MP113-05]|nr:hypothetical protein N566_24695 [Streptomycetaceae bacterium MP113-05]
MKVEEVVRCLLTDKFGVDASDIESHVPLRRLRMDSLALEELRLLVEERLDVDLDAVELTSRDTVGHLLGAVQSAARNGGTA